MLVCGGRDFDQVDDVRTVVRVLQWVYGDRLRILHGGARGADRIAGSVASELEIVAKAFPAEWNVYGKAAGAIRNEAMAEYLAWCESLGHSVEVIAFKGGRGTADMVRRAEARGFNTTMV